MSFSIRAKLLSIIGVVFLVLAAGIIIISSFMVRNITREAEKAVDAITTKLFNEKMNGLYAHLDRSYNTLQTTLKETGLAGTQMAKSYEAEAQAQLLKALRSASYENTSGEDAKVYPFIIDGQGLVVLHPVLAQGDKSVASLEFIQKMLATDQGSFQYIYNNESKWMFFKKFAPWKWTVGYAITEDVKYAGVQNIANLLLSLRNNLTLIVAVMAVLSMLLLAIFVTRSIIRPIDQVIAALNSGADQVVDASGQVAENNQAIAQGASEQAAAIEETSSSCEQMSAMTTQNANNAKEANVLMETTNQVVEQANGSMGALTSAMQDISKASDETAKIIKTIDGIAFQTNLLALNAAVEAARAGEAGAGFAVVADEVRGLAMRAADAARNTAELIESTVSKVKEGNGLVGKTSEAFGQVTGNAAKVKELVAEIAAASAEQAQGVEQINKAVNEMDKVVQQNAAYAEEGASASQQLSAQSERMKDVVGELVALVRGHGNNDNKSDNLPAPVKLAARDRVNTKQLVNVSQKVMARRPSAVSPARQTRVISPAQMIPLDDDFKNF